MHNLSITEFRIVKNHPYLKALVNLKVQGIHLRGLRLEENAGGELSLGFPGRKVQGHWQVVYEADDRHTESQLLQLLGEHYRGKKVAA